MSSETITIGNTTFALVKKRVYTSVRIYKGDHTFLRIGDKDDISKDLSFHKKLLELDFPVAKILDEGTHNGEDYFLEESLGETYLAQQFSNDMETSDKISDTVFAEFVAISKKFVKAQLNTATTQRDFEDFFTGIHTDYIYQELPHMKKKLDIALEKVMRRLSNLPFVLTHGDFNAHNMYTKGIIDFEHAFYAPLGYDPITAISHVFFFPDKDLNYETFKWYDFSAEEKKQYLHEIQDVNPTSNFLDYLDDLIFCRSIWLTVRMDRYPRFQQWRYELFEKILNTYLENKSVYDLLINLG